MSRFISTSEFDLTSAFIKVSQQMKRCVLLAAKLVCILAVVPMGKVWAGTKSKYKNGYTWYYREISTQHVEIYGVSPELNGSVVIPSSFQGSWGDDWVDRIGDNAFDGHTRLKSVDIPSGVRRIGVSAFSGCSSLERIEISENVTNVGAFAFSSCSSLEEVRVRGRSDTRAYVDIGAGAFSGCPNLQTVRFSYGANSVGSGAFNGCNGLTSVIVDDLSAWCGS